MAEKKCPYQWENTSTGKRFCPCIGEKCMGYQKPYSSADGTKHDGFCKIASGVGQGMRAYDPKWKNY